MRDQAVLNKYNSMTRAEMNALCFKQTGTMLPEPDENTISLWVSIMLDIVEQSLSGENPITREA